MSDTATIRPNRVRTIAFATVVVLLVAVVLVLFNGLTGLLAPWVVWPDPVDHGFVRTPQLHRMADAQASAVMALLGVGCLVGLLRRPLARPALLQLWIVVFGAILVLGPLIGANDDASDDLATLLIGAAVGLTGFVILPAVLYPAPRALLRLGPRVRPHPLVGGVAAVAALGLVAWVVATVAWHMSGRFVEHPVEDDWMGSVFLGGGLLVALALVVGRRPGWQWLAATTAVTIAYTGVASVVLPDAPTGWGTVGGAAGIVVAVALAVAAHTAARRQAPAAH